jgi:hypothetical protein
MADDGELKRVEMREELGRLEQAVYEYSAVLPGSPDSHEEMMDLHRRFRTFGTSPVFYYGPIQPLPMMMPISVEDAPQSNATPSLPESSLKFQVNLVPGGPRRAPVDVNTGRPPAELTAEMRNVRSRVGEAAWPAFTKRWRELHYTLNRAAQEVDGLRDAITDDDFVRWSAAAAKHIASADACIAALGPELERVHAPLLSAVREFLAALKPYFALLTRRNPFDQASMFVTGEYER